MAASERIVLGSGKLYCVEYSGTLPEDATIETADNLLGYIGGGASVEYKPLSTPARTISASSRKLCSPMRRPL